MEKKLTEVQKSMYESSEKIEEVKKIVKRRAKKVGEEELIPENLADDNWKEKKFSHPETIVRIGTVFSGIGAIEYALKRLNLKHEIVFAGDVDAKW